MRRGTRFRCVPCITLFLSTIMKINVNYSGFQLDTAADFIWKENKWVPRWIPAVSDSEEVRIHIKQFMMRHAEELAKDAIQDIRLGRQILERFACYSTGGYTVTLNIQDFDAVSMNIDCDILVDPAVGADTYNHTVESIDI